MEGVEVAYGPAAPAIRGISLKVPEGSAIAVLGANGAGKTTTIRAVTGVLSSYKASITRGTIVFRGEDVTDKRSHQLVPSGVSQVPEGRMVFGQLTVEENLRLGADVVRNAKRDDELQRVLDLFPVLGERRSQKAGWLSGGEQQMLAIGRAMMSSPTLMVLDEVSLGLAPMITRTIYEQLREIRLATSMSMLLVEQNARVALEFCDYAYVLESGRVVIEGPAAELGADSKVQDLYLGGAPGERQAEFGGEARQLRRKRWLR